MRNQLLVLVISSLLALHNTALADVSEATFTPQGSERFASIQESQVTVYVIKPDFKFRIIGIIEARGMAEGDSSIFGIIDGAVNELLGSKPTQPGEKEDIALAMRALRKEASEYGALGVIIIRSVQVRVSQQSTERRIVAAAIRPE